MADRPDAETGRPLQRGSRPLTLTYKGRSVTFDMPGWYGDAPDDGEHSVEDMKVSDRALNRLKAEADGLLLPEEIRRIRGKLRLTQVQAGELIGGGPRAFQKYEAGDVLPSRGISNFLAVLDANPEALRVVRAREAGGTAAQAQPVPG